MYRARRADVEAHLRDARGLILSAADLAHLDYVFKAFFELGPGINYGGYQQGLSTSNVDFARLSLAADADGVLRSFLGSDDSFQLIREMHRRNLIVPIEGDFAGPKALRAIGEYVRSHDARVETFYISNVEQYLFGQTVARQTDRNGGYRAFYENAATLPVNDNSVFVRALNLASPAPLCPMSMFLEAALSRPITSVADARSCAGTTTEPIGPTSQPAALSRARATEAFTTRVRTGNDVTWLEQMAASEEFLRREWMNAVGTDQVSANLRMDAYVRLGAIGTPDSLAAVRRIDAELRRQSILAEPSLTGWVWPMPGPGSGGGRMVALNAVKAGDREYAVVVSEIDGPFAPFVLTRTRSDARWQRPRLVGAPIPNASSFDPVVTIDGDALAIGFQRRPAASDMVPVPPPLRVPLAAIEQDTDGDGWTDIEERALGLRPDLEDTDGDGISDRLDATPLHKPAPGEERDEDAQIIRRAWFAAYAHDWIALRDLRAAGPSRRAALRTRRSRAVRYGAAPAHGLRPRRASRCRLPAGRRRRPGELDVDQARPDGGRDDLQHGRRTQLSKHGPGDAEEDRRRLGRGRMSRRRHELSGRTDLSRPRPHPSRSGESVFP